MKSMAMPQKHLQCIVLLGMVYPLFIVAKNCPTKNAYNFLKKMNSDCIQGYYFGKPVTESEITRQLEQGCGEVES